MDYGSVVCTPDHHIGHLIFELHCPSLPVRVDRIEPYNDRARVRVAVVWDGLTDDVQTSQKRRNLGSRAAAMRDF